MTSIKDVAKAAGVSTATVSRVLSDRPNVRPEIRDRVLAVVENLNYRPNRVARSLRVQKSNIIGLIVSDIQNPFFTAVSRAVEDLAYQQGLSVFLCNADDTPKKEKMYLDLMRDENVAGVILSPTRQTVDSFAEVANLEIPVVAIDRRVRDIEVDNVLIDNVEAAHKIVEHLVADASKARTELGWEPTVDFADLVRMMVDADLDLLRAGRGDVLVLRLLLRFDGGRLSADSPRRRPNRDGRDLHRRRGRILWHAATDQRRVRCTHRRRHA